MQVTYRKLQTHFKASHAGFEMAIVCKFNGCSWVCGRGSHCYVDHLKYDHNHKACNKTAVKLIELRGDSSRHSDICTKMQNLVSIKLIEMRANQKAAKIALKEEKARSKAKINAVKVARKKLKEIKKKNAIRINS